MSADDQLDEVVAITAQNDNKLPSPDSQDAMLGRVGGAVSRLRAIGMMFDTAVGDADAIDALLAAYQSVREERYALREAVEYVVECDDSKWVQYFKDELAEIDAARTGGTE